MNTIVAVALLLGAPQQAPPPVPVTIACEAQTSGVRCKDTVTVIGDQAARAGSRPLSSSVLTEDELRALGPDALTWIDFATRSAGTSVGSRQMFIDGMPAAGDIPAALISRIAVNADPFSVENDGVDQIRVDVDLTEPLRRWSFDASGLSLGAGGRELLAHTSPPESRNVSAGVGGPVPGAPITFSIHGNRFIHVRQPVFASASTGAAFSDDGLTTRTDSSTLSASAVYSVPRVRVRATFLGSSLTLAHAGAGALIAAGAGSAIAGANTQFQTSWRVTGQTWIEHGGFSWRRDAMSATADSQGPAIVVTQQSISGGNEIAAETRRASGWVARDVFESAGDGHSWLIGTELAHDDIRDTQQSNPSGRLQLSGVGAASGTWFVTRGMAASEAATASIALFAQRILSDSRRFTVRTGFRADWQERDGVVVSPRVTMRALAPAGIQIAIGAGVFADTIRPGVLLDVARRDGLQAQTFIVPGVATSEFETSTPSIAGGVPLTARMAQDFTRRKDVVVRGAINRQFGRWSIGAEQIWTEGLNLAGSRRAREAGNLVDVVASDRHLARHQTHARAVARWKHHSLTLHYEYARSFDDTDGPLSLPQRFDDSASEWGPSSLVSRHTVGAVVVLSLPAAVHLAMTFDAHSGRPFTVLTGRDAEGLASYTDRGGLPRNSALGPSARNLHAYVYRAIAPKRLRGIKLDAGVRFQNLLNSENAVSVGQVMNSPLFGRVLNALPGRSARAWITVGR